MRSGSADVRSPVDVTTPDGMTVHLAAVPGLRARRDTLRDAGGLVVDLLAALDAALTCEEFGRAAAVGAARIIECTAATFDEIDVSNASPITVSTDARLTTDEAVAARRRWAPAGPIAQHGGYEPDSPPLTISRVVGRQEFQASESYRAFYGPHGVEDQLVICTAGMVLQLDRAGWEFDDFELSQAFEIQRVLRVMWAVHRDREARRVGATVAMGLVEKSGRAVLVRDRAGVLRDLDGAPVSLEEPVGSAVRSAVAVALLSPPKGGHGAPLVEITVPTDTGAQMSVRVLAPPAPGSLLSVVVERAPSGPALEDLLRHNLTARQAEVMEMILGGSTNGGVAHRLGISERTVEKHVIAAYSKLGARTRTEALLKVLR